MVELEPNSCRICLAITQTDERQVLLVGENILSEVGLLYEEILSLPIAFDGTVLKYICSSCDLQLKMFKDLKSKALETHLLLSDLCNLSEYEYDHPNTGSYILENNDETKIEIIEQVEDDHIVNDMSLNFTDVDAVGEDENVDAFDELEEIKYLDQETILEDDSEIQDEEYLFEIEDIKIEYPPDESSENKMCEVFPCHACNKTFSVKTRLMNHKRKMHSKSNKFSCSLCSKVMYSEEALKVHLNLHNGLPAYQCKVCEKTFKQKFHYNYHMLNHRNERNIICDVCQKGFISKSDLKIHKRMHTDERLYKCDICDKAFRANSHMVNHRYSHFEKQFECPACFQKYVSPNTLRTHFRTVHIADVPFECEFCEKKFKRKHHLVAHYKTHNKAVAVEVESET